MRSAQIAEWILGLFLEPGRAAAYTGDLLEEAAENGPIWFWSSGARLAIMRFGYDVAESPFFLAGVLLRACIQNIAVTCFIIAGSIILLIVPFALFAGLLHAVFGLRLSVTSEPVRWIGSIGGTAMIVLAAFYTGRWIAVKMPGREIAACIAMCMAQPLFWFIIGLLITRIWAGPIEHYMRTHPGPAQSEPLGLADTGLNYLMTFIGFFVGALKIRSRSLR